MWELGVMTCFGYIVVVLRNLVQLYTCININKTHNIVRQAYGTGLRPTYINRRVLTSSILKPLAPL